MRHLQTNNIHSIAADYEDGNFPATNLLDDRPKRKWSAGGMVRNATLTAAFSAGVDSIYIGGTNALEAVADAYDPNELTLMPGLTLGPGITLGNPEITGLTITTTVKQDINAMLIDISPAITRPCVVTINLTASGSETLCAGVISGAVAEDYGGAFFRYGASESMVDHSISAENSDGSRYYKKRSIARQFQLAARMLRAEANNLFKSFRQYGSVSTAWVLFDAQGDFEDLVYGYATMSRAADHRLYDNVTINITEAI